MVEGKERAVNLDDIGDGGKEKFDNSKRNMLEAMRILKTQDNG